MKLELHRITISKLVFGAQTGVSGGVLTVNKDELTALLMQDERLGGVEIDAAHPGENTRIMPVKDAIEPRCKLEGPGEVFPGWIGDVENAGRGPPVTGRVVQDPVAQTVAAEQRRFEEITAGRQRHSPRQARLIKDERASGQARHVADLGQVFVEEILNPLIDRRKPVGEAAAHFALARQNRPHQAGQGGAIGSGGQRQAQQGQAQIDRGVDVARRKRGRGF